MTNPQSSSADPTAIAVIGATGYVGRHICVEALKRGHSVLGLSRTPATNTPDGMTPALLSGNPTLSSSIVRQLLEVISRCGCRLGVVGGAGGLLVAPDGPRLVDTADFPQAAKPEALAQVDALDQLRSSTSTGDWFYLSPAAKFGSHSPGIRTGKYRIGGDVLLRDESGRSAISGDDYAIALMDEVEQPVHHRQRFSVAY